MNDILLYSLLIVLLVSLVLSILFAEKASSEVYSLIKNSENILTDSPISLEKLSKIEGSIEDLQQVFIFANIIEAPDGDLKKSVIDNFKRYVEYSFVISKNNYNEFKETYYKIFDAYSCIAKVKPEKVLKIYPLEIEWGDKPYIFYRYQYENSFHVIGFVGFEMNKGLASSYMKLEKDFAYTLFNTATAACDVDLKMTLNKEEFETDKKVFKLNVAI